jgi:cystathionine beta-lyase family protein involved in aluminum resistance
MRRLGAVHPQLRAEAFGGRGFAGGARSREKYEPHPRAGGYIVGSEKYVDLIGRRLTAPSIGNEVGSYAYGYRLFYQGLFMAPHTVNQAIKGSLVIGKCMENLGYENFPKLETTPADITRAIRFDTAEQLCAFIQSVQEASPVDSFVTLEPWDMPGYDSKVIMAAGCFVEGASVELSADAPVKPPTPLISKVGLRMSIVNMP